LRDGKEAKELETMDYLEFIARVTSFAMGGIDSAHDGRENRAGEKANSSKIEGRGENLRLLNLWAGS